MGFFQILPWTVWVIKLFVPTMLVYLCIGMKKITIARLTKEKFLLRKHFIAEELAVCGAVFCSLCKSKRSECGCHASWSSLTVEAIYVLVSKCSFTCCRMRLNNATRNMFNDCWIQADVMGWKHEWNIWLGPYLNLTIFLVLMSKFD